MGKLFKIALAIFLIGVGFVAFFSILSEEPIWGLSNEDTYTLRELSYDAEDFSGFDFNFDNRDIIVRESETEDIFIKFYESERDDFIVTDTESTLKIVNDIEWYNRIFMGWTFLGNDEYYDVYVYLPTTEVYDIDFDTSNGTFNVLELDNLDEVTFKTSNGRIELENVTARSLDLDSSNGGVVLTDVTVSEGIDAYTSNGKFILTDVTASTKIKLKTSNGKVTLTNVTANEINADTSNSSIVADNVIFDVLTLDTSNGSVTVTIQGQKEDFEVNMSSSNGDLNYDGIEVSQELFNEGASKRITLDSSNGDITITFND